MSEYVSFSEWPCAVGDEVWVLSSGSSPVLKKVEKIGHKLIHVKSGWNTTAYRLDTYYRHDGQPGSIQTQAQRTGQSRIDFAKRALRDHYGIDIRPNFKQRWTVESLESLLVHIAGILGPR